MQNLEVRTRRRGEGGGSSTDLVLDRVAGRIRRGWSELWVEGESASLRASWQWSRSADQQSGHAYGI